MWIFENDPKITFLLMKNESMGGEKWILARHPCNSNSKKARIVSISLPHIVHPSLHIIFSSHLLIILWWSSFKHKFLCIQFMQPNKQVLSNLLVYGGSHFSRAQYLRISENLTYHVWYLHIILLDCLVPTLQRKWCKAINMYYPCMHENPRETCNQCKPNDLHWARGPKVL